MLVREEQLLIQHLRCPVVKQWSHISWLIFREGPHFSQMGRAEIVVLSDNTSGELERLQRTHKKDAEKLETAYKKLTNASEMILRLVKTHDSQAEQIAHSARENECFARDLVQNQSELEVVCRRLESLRSIPSSSQPNSEGRLRMPVKDWTTTVEQMTETVYATRQFWRKSPVLAKANRGLRGTLASGWADRRRQNEYLVGTRLGLIEATIVERRSELLNQDTELYAAMNFVPWSTDDPAELPKIGAMKKDH